MPRQTRISNTNAHCLQQAHSSGKNTGLTPYSIEAAGLKNPIEDECLHNSFPPFNCLKNTPINRLNAARISIDIIPQWKLQRNTQSATNDRINFIENDEYILYSPGSGLLPPFWRNFRIHCLSPNGTFRG